ILRSLPRGAGRGTRSSAVGKDDPRPGSVTWRTLDDEPARDARGTLRDGCQAQMAWSWQRRIEAAAVIANLEQHLPRLGADRHPGPGRAGMLERVVQCFQRDAVEMLLAVHGDRQPRGGS